MTIDGYFTGKSGKRYSYAELSQLIREKATATFSKHISVQLQEMAV